MADAKTRSAAGKSVAKRQPGDPQEASQTVIRDFRSAVNMTPSQLEHWLESAESRKVGFKGESGGESIGHRSGRRIVRLMGKDPHALTDGDIAHMRKVTGYVHRILDERRVG